MGGCKEAAMAIVGTGVYGKLKYENGVHRVQVGSHLHAVLGEHLFQNCILGFKASAHNDCA